MRECHDFIDRRSPEGIRVWMPIEDPKGAELVYPDVPCFLADGRSFVFHSSEGPKICYLEKKVRTRRLFPDCRGRHFVITFGGRYAYYTEQDDVRGGSLTLYRKNLETFRTEELFHASRRLPGTNLPVKRFSRIQTISSDHRRIATTGCFLGDGTTPDAPFGILVLDLDTGETRIAAQDRDFVNPHAQYCRSTEGDASHDLLLQMNHGSHTDAKGRGLVGLGPPSDGGVDAHVVRDDGTTWRDLPWGRDGKESLIGHQIWRGNTRMAVTVTLENLDTSYGWADGSRQEVAAGWPVQAPRDAHLGKLTPGGQRVLLSEGVPHPRFCHLCTDATGLRFALDTFPIFDGERAGMQVYYAQAPDERAPLTFTYLLNSRNTFTGQSLHAHPILSPDGSLLLFNSAISGTSQFYLVTGLNENGRLS